MEGTKGSRGTFCEVLGGAIENVPTFGITHFFSSLYVILIHVIDTIQYRNKPGRPPKILSRLIEGRRKF